MSYLPEAFTWHDTPDRGGHREMSIAIGARSIRILSGAGKKFLEAAEAGEDGFYRVAIGIAPKAVAIRALEPEKGKGFRARKPSQATAKGSSLIISCKTLIENKELKPMHLPAAWDPENKMLVAKMNQE